jgi:hypothetical protein
MIDWKIDCQTFLLLTGTSLGEWGIHIIDESGVCSSITPKSIADAPYNSTECASLLDAIESAKLTFSTNSSKLIVWIDDQGGDFVVPDWFRAAVNADGYAAAQQTLCEAKSALEEQLAAMRSSAPSSAQQRHILRRSTDELIAELEAIDRLRSIPETGAVHPAEFEAAEALSGVSDAGTAGPKEPIRLNPLSLAITPILEALGKKATVPQVMKQLRSLAGKEGSCVLGSTQDGSLRWRRSDGSEAELDRIALKKRLIRMGWRDPAGR